MKQVQGIQQFKMPATELIILKIFIAALCLLCMVRYTTAACRITARSGFEFECKEKNGDESIRIKFEVDICDDGKFPKLKLKLYKNETLTLKYEARNYTDVIPITTTESLKFFFDDVTLNGDIHMKVTEYSGSSAKPLLVRTLEHKYCNWFRRQSVATLVMVGVGIVLFLGITVMVFVYMFYCRGRGVFKKLFIIDGVDDLPYARHDGMIN